MNAKSGTDGMMRALIYEGPRQLTIRQQPIPIPQVDEVLIRVERVGICGSELSGYLGHNSLRKPPLVMGHEFAGTIAAIGEGADIFAIGDRVTVNPLVYCGVCADCKAGSANLCKSRSLIGAGQPGAFAEYVIAPKANVLVLPEGISMDEGALVEPVACAVRICRLAKITPSDHLLIVGAGPIGLLVFQIARLFGIVDIVVMDINPERLEVVTQLGGIAVVSVDELIQVQPSEGFDVTVDAVGMDVTRQQCMISSTPGGRVVFSGLHAPESVIPVNLAIRNELTMIGSFAYNPMDFDSALQWIIEGRIDLRPWLTHAPLEDGQACFEKLINNPGKTVKFMLTL